MPFGVNFVHLFFGSVHVRAFRRANASRRCFSRRRKVVLIFIFTRSNVLPVFRCNFNVLIITQRADYDGISGVARAGDAKLKRLPEAERDGLSARRRRVSRHRSQIVKSSSRQIRFETCARPRDARFVDVRLRVSAGSYLHMVER